MSAAELVMALVERAIKASKRETRTVELERSDAVEAELLAECDGNDGEGLYWGQDCDGNEWQVRLV